MLASRRLALAETRPSYRGRYPELAFRRGVWREIARWVEDELGPPAAVVELGPGFCDFINASSAAERWALDVNPDMAQHAAAGVRFLCADVAREWPIPPASADLVFASNFLEHLTREEGRKVLARTSDALRPGGRVALLQPNFRLCAARYFEDETHIAAYSDESLVQALLDVGFSIERVVPGLLPFSMRSRLPKWPGLVRAYLRSPLRPFAAQMFVVGRKR